ncbi:MAG: hypothetical protein GXY54_01345 [Deltaproteobacteria bacterium]|nr:hypothetical protein [Deltaproteobacteria bacterium]
MVKEEQKEKGLLGSVFTAYFVLVFHVLLIVLLCLAVVFLRGFNEYLGWIVFGGIALIGLSIYLFIRKMRRDNQKIRDLIRDPAFQGKSLEISFLGGMATLKVANNGPFSAELGAAQAPPQLEDPHTIRIRELSQIARLLENNMITQAEFDSLKEEILKKFNQ